MIIVTGSFDRSAIDTVSAHLKLPMNMMFITCPGAGMELSNCIPCILRHDMTIDVHQFE
jgi:hypothetical protein